MSDGKRTMCAVCGHPKADHGNRGDRDWLGTTNCIQCPCPYFSPVKP